jgi:hypothetical protein
MIKRTSIGLLAAGLLILAVWSGFDRFGEPAAVQLLADDEQATAAPDFATQIAPLLVHHCLECHDAATRKGGLDLSRRESVQSGGDSGTAIVAGRPSESLLWQRVESDEMPHDRPPLSGEQKRLLREWIDGGAPWTVDAIEPADYRKASETSVPWVQRLTNAEYVATVRAATGVDIEREARELLPPEVRADGFTNTAYNLAVDLPHIEAYSRLAALIVERMNVAEFIQAHAGGDEASRLLEARGPALSGDEMRGVIRSTGRWLLRGPLDEQEVEGFLGVARAVAELDGGGEEALGYVVEAMLQSPRFIYRVERQRGDGSSQPLGHYELASRLSYILWGAPPDEELLRAAEAGELGSRDAVAVQVRRMLQDPRCVARSLQFAHDWLDLGRLANLRPDPQRFPGWSPQLAADMRSETLAYFEEVAWKERRPLSDLMNAEFTFATPLLAEHYGLNRERSEASQPQLAEAVRQAPSRVMSGLQVLYLFHDASGEIVRDVSGSSDPLNLRIADTGAVKWTEAGLEITAPTVITAGDPPARLIDAARESNELTLEGWITPASASQAGPARIASLSTSVLARNFTLGQDGDRYDVRFRTTDTSDNGQPSLTSPPGSAAPTPTHVVYTRDAQGRAVVYVNGAEAGQSQVGGDLSNWDRSFQLMLGNELSGDRPWLGTLHLTAIYNRALSADEVLRNHAAGARPGGTAAPAGPVGLEALYTFKAGGGGVVRDEAGTGEPLDLKISDLSAVSWTADGLALDEPVLIATSGPAERLSAAVRASEAITIDAWITPADAGLTGPARIVTLSETTGRRNFTLGQDGTRFDVRFRTSATNENGIPSLAAPEGSVQTRMTRVVYTRDSAGQARIYVDGDEVAAANVEGDLSNWDGTFRLGLGNETTEDRPWRGTYHRLAIYSRALSPDELRQSAGPMRYELADRPERGGLLTQGSLLTIGGDDASTVTRGLFVLFDFLYGQVGSPPACVDTTPVPASPGQSRRAVAEARLANPACGGCHAKFEPFAFGLEKFDGVGAFHQEDEHGNALREDGEIRIPGEAQPARYESTAELMDLLSGSDRVQRCLTRKVAQFALGRPLSAADAPILDTIHAEAQAAGGTYEALITAIVLSDLVRSIHTEAAE